MPEVRKKVILINAATVKLAGGLVVSLDLIHLLAKSGAYKLVLLCPKIKSYVELPNAIQKVYTPNYLLKFYFRWVLDFIWLPERLQRTAPNLVLTLGNLPARTLLKQLMLNDNAFVTQKKLSEIPLSFSNKLKHGLRKYLFWKRLHFVDCLLVQTQTEVNRLESFNRPLPEIKKLAPLLPKHLTAKPDPKPFLPKQEEGVIRLLCLSYYWDHKNIDILKDVLELAKQKKEKLQIVFTLNEKKVKGGKHLVRSLNSFLTDGSAINVGNVKAEAITTLIDSCDGLILPSLLETYGLNSLEAWHGEKVFLVADRPYSREVCSDAAVFFDPNNAKEILNKILEVFYDRDKVDGLIAKGQKQLAKLPKSERYISVIEEALRS